MKGDFTRDTFQAHKHFSRVLMQQGRVSVEADWNEQAAILLHDLRARTEDLIGPHGGPQANLGFTISLPEEDDLSIGPGRYYVDGLLCENDSTYTYKCQPDYTPSEDEPLPEGEPYLIYLDVWERHLSHLEDDAIREVALGGPDTATRAKVVWQVKIVKSAESAGAIKKMNRDKFRKLLTDLTVKVSPGPGQLSARIKPDMVDDDPCTLPPDSRYRGAENQLYRVEIHAVTKEHTTFKWSRDNGSLAALCLKNEGEALVVSATRGFEARGWVELITDAQELRGEPGTLVKVNRVEGDRLVLETLPGGVKWDEPVKVRRWEQTETEVIHLSEGAVPVPVTEGEWRDLEDGVQILFKKNGEHRVGDYWLIPARTATQDVEWPQASDGPSAQPPHGIEHHYAPLARIEAGVVTDLRRKFAPQAV